MEFTAYTEFKDISRPGDCKKLPYCECTIAPPIRALIDFIDKLLVPTISLKVR